MIELAYDTGFSTNGPPPASDGVYDFQQLQRGHILLVEDDDLQRELLSAHLGEWGLKVRTARDGHEALGCLREDPSIRLMLTDLQMPGMDGLELLVTLKNSIKQRLYTIVISGLNDRGALTEALQAGATDYMVKPCHPEQLYMKLAVWDRVMHLEQGYQHVVKDLFDVMSEMLGSRDNYTLEHSLRVAAVSRRIGHTMGLLPSELATLEMGSLIHDIGKIAIPDDVLLKPGRFDKLDKRIMKMHPAIGARFLASRYHDDRVTEIVLQHHERLDGTGYPAGLKGDAVGQLVRIVMTADIFEALIAKRPYKESMSQEEALAVLREEVDKGRLDGTVVDALQIAISGWDPLAIQRSLYTDIVALESFRRMTYFREPLCSFYNYRYLLILDQNEQISKLSSEYHLGLIDFRNLRELNKKWGYLRADQILDELGENIQRTIKTFAEMHKNTVGETLLFRKGADFLFFSNYQQDLFHRLTEVFELLVAHYEEQWEVKTSLLSESFPASLPLERAFDRIFGLEVTPAPHGELEDSAP